VAAQARTPALGMSDHWSFWQAGYKATMVTDTSFYRNRCYYTASDTPEKLNYPRMAEVVRGLAGMMGELAGFT
jgi:hypothetical protein